MTNPKNLTANLEAAIQKSNETNRQKALDNPNNRRAIALLRTLVEKGMSLTEMAKTLNDEGFVAPKGGRFKASQVSVLLKRYKLK